MKYLLKGDISGIQEFIFNVKSKGAAKALKARSYYIQLLGYMACQYTSQKLPNAELFYEGGGAFFISFELDDTQVVDDLFLELESNVKKTFSSYGVYINLAYVSKDVEDFGKTWSNLRKESNRKNLSYNVGNHFFEPFFRTNEEVNKSDIKQLFKILQITDTVPIYDNLVEIFGAVVNEELLNHLDYFDKYPNSLEDKIPMWGGYNELDSYKQFRQNNASDYTNVSDLSATDIVDFDGFGDFAKHRTGTGKIAVLKLDVDNLGKLFGQIKKEGKGKENSRKMSKFFNEYFYEKVFNGLTFEINDITEGYKANVYPIFSGGDDCFVIGSWDAILCFSIAFQKAFTEEITKTIKIDNGGQLTVSAGIVLVDPTHPVSSFSELAEEALAKSKSKGKNKVTIFDLTFTWEEFSHMVEVSKLLAKEMESKKISRAYLDKIRKSAKGFNSLQNTNGADFDRIYKLKYYLSKNAEALGSVVDKLFEPYYETLKANLLKEERKDSYNVAIYPAIARVTELLTKTKLNYERR